MTRRWMSPLLCAALAAACGDKDDPAPASGGEDTGAAEVGCEAPGTWFYDADGDGHGAADRSTEACEAPRGWVASSDDCDDIAGDVHPGVDELCDGVDNDCDGVIDPPGTPGAAVYYLDADGDGYGDLAAPVEACEQPAGAVEDATDCDDADPLISPAGTEVCGDGADNDCAGGDSVCALMASGDLVTLGVPRVAGTEAGASLGRSVSSADVDGDGQADLLAGAYLGGGNVGEAFVAHGPLSGDTLTTDHVRIVGETAYGYLGHSVAGVPDVDGDGYDEVAVSAIAITAGGPGGGAGVVYLFFGPIGPGSADLNPTMADETLTYSPGRANVGSRLWAGDFTGDGLADLLVGAETGDSSKESGFWTVSGTGLGSGPLDAVGTFWGEESAGDRAGSEVRVVQDTDGDGLDDVLVSATHSSSGATDGGTVYLFLDAAGSTGGIIDSADVFFDGETAYGFLGQSLAGGDLDGDGYGDVVVGAYDDDDFTDYGGVARVYPGPLSPGMVLDDSTIVVAGDEVSGRLANGLAVRDLNGDSTPELVVTWTAADSYAGGVVVFEGPVADGTYAPGDATRAWNGAAAGDGFQLELQPVGDLTGDGLLDVAFGQPSWSAGDQRGAVFVLPATGG